MEPMRLGTAIVALVLLGTLVPAAAATPPVHPGPFAGTVEEGETATHTYRTAPPGTACVDIVTKYVVTLAYAPPTDKLGLEAGGNSTTGENGTAVVTALASPCFLEIVVRGEDVEETAAYTVAVAQTGPLAITHDPP